MQEILDKFKFRNRIPTLFDDVVKLMADLIFLPVADQIESGTYLVYDGVCGTGGMLTGLLKNGCRSLLKRLARKSPFITIRKSNERKGKVQLIDATGWYQSLRKNMGKKNCELNETHIQDICNLTTQPEETEQSKILPTRHSVIRKLLSTAHCVCLFI